MANNNIDNPEYPSFHIPICLIQIWDLVDPTKPLAEPTNVRMITEVENIEIEDSYKELIGTASVRFPRGTVIKKTITEVTRDQDVSRVTATVEDTGVLITTRADSKKAEVTDFKVGSRIRIKLGYTTNPKIAALAQVDSEGKSIHNDTNKLTEYQSHLATMFDGYITKCSLEFPIELHCENLASGLKKKSCPDRMYKNVTVNDMLAANGGTKGCAALLKDTGLDLHPDTAKCNINVGDIKLNSYLTVADILTGWSKYKVYSFIKYNGTTPCIAVGRTYFSNAGDDSILKLTKTTDKIPKILFNYHVAKNNLTSLAIDKKFLAVEATCLDSNDKFYHITIRPNPAWSEDKPNVEKWDICNEVKISKKAMEMGARVLGKSTQKVDLSTYTIVPYMSRNLKISHDQLLKEAIKYYEEFNMNGIEGTLTLFGDLALKSGMQVELVDELYPYKNGRYIVEEVTTTFGVNGYRQKISLPYCIERTKPKNNESK